jgi:hypothetical protein
MAVLYFYVEVRLGLRRNKVVSKVQLVEIVSLEISEDTLQQKKLRTMYAVGFKLLLSKRKNRRPKRKTVTHLNRMNYGTVPKFALRYKLNGQRDRKNDSKPGYRV